MVLSFKLVHSFLATRLGILCVEFTARLLSNTARDFSKMRLPKCILNISILIFLSLMLTWSVFFFSPNTYLVPDGDMQQHESSKGVGGEDRNSMLQVICSQRDRFRQRLRVTEEVSLCYNFPPCLSTIVDCLN